MAQLSQSLGATAHRIAGSAGAFLADLQSAVGQGTIRKFRIFAICFVLIFAIGFLLITMIKPKYSATAVLAPQTPLQSNSLTGDGSPNLGNIGSLLGSKPKSDGLIAFQALVGTASFADYAIRHDHLDRIIFPEGVRRSLISTWLHELFGQGRSDQVTAADVQRFIQSNIYFQPNEGSGYVDVSFADQDRGKAINVLRILIYSGDHILRAREGTSLDEQIKYLSHALQTLTDVEQMNLLRKLLGQKLSSKVLLATQATYSFEIFDPPNAPPAPNSPSIAIMFAALLIASLMLSAVTTISYFWWDGRVHEAVR